MDTRLKYQAIVKSVLQEYCDERNSLPDPYKSYVLFDDDRGHYLLLDLGWNDEKYLHATPIHIDLIGAQIWIQYNDPILNKLG